MEQKKLFFFWYPIRTFLWFFYFVLFSMNYKILDLEYDILSLKYFKPRCLSLQNNSLNPKNLPLQILLFFLKKNYLHNLHNIFINNHSTTTRRRRPPLFFDMTILIVSLGITRGVFLSRMRPFEIWIDRFGDTDPSFWPKMKKKFLLKNTFEHFLGVRNQFGAKKKIFFLIHYQDFFIIFLFCPF